jgi:hypothetical protein
MPSSTPRELLSPPLPAHRVHVRTSAHLLCPRPLHAPVGSRWGVDYVKFDDCGEMNLASYAKFSVMGDAIRKTGRSMVYSFEPYTGGLKTRWLGTVGNSWRTGPDARPHYSSVIGNAFVNNMAASLAGPGHFNDADSARDNPFVCVRACCRNRCLLSVMLRGASCSARDREW